MRVTTSLFMLVATWAVADLATVEAGFWGSSSSQPPANPSIPLDSTSSTSSSSYPDPPSPTNANRWSAWTTTPLDYVRRKKLSIVTSRMDHGLVSSNSIVRHANHLCDTMRDPTKFVLAEPSQFMDELKSFGKLEPHYLNTYRRIYWRMG
ncbi:hypothetical protein BJ085DRAFT_30872 [Dimargaris cristalligena]|uniref:Uncharacterized protein n=1 Tax=Dimargaris cristalligena TaxID=215637 RepID=A0A4P9ZRD2_9FUNG|nr:hypothetical protein BJ085DRAFT_30872 [Dimargaris cristalligena]|eukprot:RKP35957.1 hypothetical protein BJ085DRAFT_30872 [Dimargaris cristalligena]